VVRDGRSTFHKRLVGRKYLGVLIGSSRLVVHVAGEIHRLAVEAKLGEIEGIGCAKRHIEGVSIPQAIWIIRLADGNPEERLERTIGSMAGDILILVDSRPKAPIIAIVEGAYIYEIRNGVAI